MATAAPQTGAERVERLVRRFRMLYAVLTIVSCLGVLSALADDSSSLVMLGPLLVCASIYLGLRLRRDWVVPLALFVSAGLCLTLFLTIVRPAADAPALGTKLLAGGALLFFAYQFRFFRRPEVRKLFEYRGDLVF